MKNVKVFAIVLQNFEGSVSDELSVTRGQIVEKLCADDDWMYVRNVDGRCGYIPQNFCYGMEQVINSQQWNSNEVQGSHTEAPPTTRPNRIRVNTVIAQSGSQSSVEVHSTDLPQTVNSSHSQPRQPLRSSTPITSQTAERLETPDSTPPLARSSRRLSSLQPSAEHSTMDFAESAIVEEPRYVERPHSRGVATADGTANVTNQSTRLPPRPSVRRSLSMNDGARSSCRPNPPMLQRGESIQRSISYQEAVLSAGQDPYSLVAGRNGPPLQRTSPLNPRRHPMQRVSPPALQLQRQNVPGGHVIQTATPYNCNRGGQSPDFDPTDDVFLPEPKKPVGIYRCLQAYNPKYPGELNVKEGELVILLEFGRGDWAWVMTSMNQEGLLPRQHLVRYNPRLGVGGPGLVSRRKSSSNASTQTELIVDGGCVRHASGASSASAGATAYSAGSSSSVTTPQTTPPLTRRVRRHKVRAKVASRVGGRGVALSAAPAIEPSTRWFEDVDSLERPPRPVKTNSTAQTTPPLARPPQPVHLNTTSKDTPPLKDPSPPTNTNSPVQTTPPLEKQPQLASVNSIQTTPTPAKPPRPTNLNCSVQTTPPLELRRRPNGLTTPQSVKSADCYLGNSSPNPAALLTPNPVKSADYAGTAHAEFWFNSLSSTSSIRTVNKRPTLTAIKDYDPPPSGKNCLRLCRGDVLTAQPHMHYPKGWMWVWHKNQHSFGYVPQSHIGYTYAVNRSRSNTLEEDAV